MKLKYFLVSLIAVFGFLTGCVEEADHFLDEIQVSSSYLTFPAGGGSVPTDFTSTGAWTVKSIPDWVTVSPASGGAGKVTVSFTASAATETREATALIDCGGKTQRINLLQVTEKVERPVTPIKDVIAAGSGSFRIKGTLTRIANTSYGNFYIDDGTGTIYVYGLFNSSGQYPKDAKGGWDGFGIEVGDLVTVEGPYTLYGTTPELVDATLIAVTKSLIQVADFDFTTLPTEAGTFTMSVNSKVSPLLVSTNADWLQVTDVTSDGGYVLSYAENVRTAPRTADITIKGPGAMKTISVTQDGVPATGMSVTEIIAAADDDMVQTLPSTVVVALTTKGAVLSDGQNRIYAFGNDAAALKVGDGVRMSAKKTTYNGVPELTDISEVFVDSEGNEVSHPTATDITAGAVEYTASTAEYVKLSGTLSVSGNYYNLTLDGVDPETKMGSIVYPVDELNAKSFDGKPITVTGYFNGLSSKGRYINIVATKIEEYVDNPKGTVTNPYTVSEVAKLLTEGTKFDEDIYIKGKVSAILYSFSASYGTGTFWLSDDGEFNGNEDKKGTTDYTHDFECYSVYWFDNQPWAEGNAQIAVGDEVVVCGKTTVYNGVAETASKKAWVYSVNGVTTDANGLGNAESPFNVAGAIAFIEACNAAKEAAAAADQAAPTFPDVYVKGKISAVLYTFSASYGTATFWISDDGSCDLTADKKNTNNPSHDFEAYSVYYFGGEAWQEGNTQVAEGDEVILKGQLTKYNTTYETASKKAWVYSLNGKTE